MSASPTRFLVTAAAFVVALASTLPAQTPTRSEAGFPLLEPRRLMDVTEGAESQTFDVTLDSRGRLAIGNLGGVLVYDGAWWQLVPIGQARAAFSLSARADGTVGVGGNDELGILSENTEGRLRFQSLLTELPGDGRILGQVHTVRRTRQGYAFLSENWLHVWDGKKLHTLADLRADEKPTVSIHRVADDLYVWLAATGLHRLDGTRLMPVEGGEIFRERRIDMITSIPGALLVSVRAEGLFRFDGARQTPLPGPASEWLEKNRVLCSVVLHDGRIAIGSVFGGLLLMEGSGAIDQIINSDLGLPDDLVTGMVVDRDGTLWIALNEGLVRVETNTGLSVLDARNGLKGSTYSMIRHQGELWVGTSAGVFTTAGAVRENGEPVRFRRVEEIPDSGWSMLSVGSELLIGTDMAVYEAGASSPRQIEEAGSEVAYTMYASTVVPGRVWLGLDDGLAAIRRGANGWTFEGLVPGVRGDVRTIVEPGDGTMWCGTSFSGHYRIRSAPDSPLESAGVDHFPSPSGDETYLYMVDGRMFAVRGRDILVVDPQTGALSPDPSAASLNIPGELSALVPAADGAVWMNTHPPAIAARTGGEWTGLRVLASLPPVSIETIMAEPDGVVWLGSETGLIRYSGRTAQPTAVLPPPVFSRITSGGVVIAAGASESAPGGPLQLEPSTKRLRVEISPLSQREGLRYQTRLLPAEREWSPWTSDAFIELTSLPPGDYVLEARTSAAGGGVSPPARWSFSVLRPWYRTRWALLLWALLALGLAHLYARRRSRISAQKAEALEQRVADQTRRLQHSIDELELAKLELEDANRRLEELTMRDDLTQLTNRRFFLSRLTEEWRRSRRHDLPLAVMLLDLDYFKQVNDSRGHIEGDHCLAQIGAFLSSAIRRSGEVVARYGGEEFAVLLPNSDLEEALALAEKLRQGIENLRIDAGSAPGGIVTASVGVVAVGSTASGTPDQLLSRVDQALYAAKRGGRNRVVSLPIEEVSGSRE